MIFQQTQHRPVWICTMAFCLFVAAAWQADPPLQIKRSDLRLRDQGVWLDLELANLFSRKVLGTIQSGLPAVMAIEVELAEREGRRLLKKNFTYHISYNIWEERYTLRHDSSVTGFHDLEALTQRLRKPADLFLVHTTQLIPEKTYRVELRAAIRLILAGQSKKLNTWLGDSGEMQNDISGEERDWGFRFNLTKLVTFLIGGEHSRGQAAASRRIDFRLSDLQQ